MDENILNSYMAFADAVVDEAAKIMKEGFYSKKQIETKGGISWNLVTDYDKKVEQLIISKINQQYPTHIIYAEEDTDAKGEKQKLTKEPTWIIDPIDGTYNFVRGLPLTCISVGLAINKTVVVGIVYNPLSGDKYTAVRGKGAYLNGRQIHVSTVQDFNETVVSFELIGRKLHKHYIEIIKKTNTLRLFGTAALSLCMVASGALDIYMHENLQAWDMAAGILIIEEAGGYITNLNGDELDLDGKSIIAGANRQFVEEFVKIVKQL